MDETPSLAAIVGFIAASALFASGALAPENGGGWFFRYQTPIAGSFRGVLLGPSQQSGGRPVKHERLLTSS
jgi:hypothetical protein